MVHLMKKFPEKDITKSTQTEMITLLSKVTSKNMLIIDIPGNKEMFGQNTDIIDRQNMIQIYR